MSQQMWKVFDQPLMRMGDNGGKPLEPGQSFQEEPVFDIPESIRGKVMSLGQIKNCWPKGRRFGADFPENMAHKILDELPEVDAHSHAVRGDAVKIDDQWQFEYSVVSKENDPGYIDSYRRTKLEILEKKSFKVEVQGITVNGAVVKTDRMSQARITSADNAVGKNPNRTFAWKENGVFVRLTGVQVSAIDNAVTDHVEDTLERHMVLWEQLQSDQSPTIASMESIDINIGWPGEVEEE